MAHPAHHSAHHSNRAAVFSPFQDTHFSAPMQVSVMRRHSIFLVSDTGGQAPQQIPAVPVWTWRRI